MDEAMSTPLPHQEKLIAACPKCGRRNRVVPGTVRCGNCGETFTVMAQDAGNTPHHEPPREIPTIESLATRVSELEARVSSLETRPEVGAGRRPSSPRREEPQGIVCLRVSNKRYDVGQYQNHIRFDCTFVAEELPRRARAMKGAIELCDLFGEAQLVIGYTLNKRLGPGESVTIADLGFLYNQFEPQHQWVLETELADMTFRFRVDQVMYE